MKVEVIKRITYKDKTHEPGEQVDIVQQTAAILIGRGVVKEFPKPKPTVTGERTDGAS